MQMQQCACPDCLTLLGEGQTGAITSPYHFALGAAPFLQSERNFLRSLPCSPLASASFEHSSEAAVRGFSAFFSVGAGPDQPGMQREIAGCQVRRHARWPEVE